MLAIDHLDLEAVRYTFNACQRMDARLDILTNLPPEEINRAAARARGTTDTPWRVMQVGGECGDDVFRYARNESGLLFLASSAHDAKARRLRDQSGPNGMRLGISWVVVESRQLRK